jgi:uncharacterized RDD family membrane protein YckC
LRGTGKESKMEVGVTDVGLMETKYSGVLPRLIAYVLDCSLLFMGLVVLQAILFVINPLLPILRSGGQPTPTQIHLWVFATATLPFLLYFALTIGSSRQATVGMRLLKLKVADVSGERIGFGKSLLRSAVMLIPFELNHAVMFHLAPRNAPPQAAFFIGIAAIWVVIAIYIAAILLTRRRQSVHDLVASTVVQRVGESLR